MFLGGFVFGIGMLVDNVIVVLENIYVYLECGESWVEVVIKGTFEVVVVVIVSTFIIVCVFMLIVFVEGVVG